MLKSQKLGLTHTIIFDNYLVIGFDKKWIDLNNGQAIEFDIELREDKLVLSGSLATLDKTREVDNNAM